jgi:hypothetical protein
LEAEIEARPDNPSSASPRRLLTAFAVSALLLVPFAYVVYGAGLAISAAAIAGLGILLASALGVAWASHRTGAG